MQLKLSLLYFFNYNYFCFFLPDTASAPRIAAYNMHFKLEIPVFHTLQGCFEVVSISFGQNSGNEP